MKHLPAFFDVAGRRVAVIGSGPSAAARARLALGAGASVAVYAAAEVDSLLAPLVADGAVALVRRAPRAEDFIGVALAFVATGEAVADSEAAAVVRAARVPVNVMDRPQLSDFAVPAVIDRGDVTVAVATGGSAPALARWVRARIERLLPSRLDALAALAGRFRDAVRSQIHDVPARRRFWDRAFDGAVADKVFAGRDAEAAALLLRSLNAANVDEPQPGAVHLVGAGPGDPELLTLAAADALARADVVLYDELVAPAILDRARRDAWRIPVGKRAGATTVSQARINDMLVEHARAGRRVVRLKAGDPFVFGRGGEELEHLREHGLEPRIVPGITAALGCAAATGVPLTHRDHASSLVFLSGHLKDGAPEDDWKGLARPDRTLAIYMGVAAAAEVRDRLLAAGLAGATPVAVVENGSRPEQRVSVGALGALASLASNHRSGEPALLIVGAVAAYADAAPNATRLQEAS